MSDSEQPHSEDSAESKVDQNLVAPLSRARRPTDILPTNPDDSEDPSLKEMLPYLRSLLVPLLITKTLIVYFGLNYSQFPGEGYGYGLAATIVFTCVSLGYFAWSRSRAKR